MSKPLAIIIEDHEAIRDIYAAALQMEGFQTHVSSDGRQALEDLGKLQPTLIVLDMNLPHVSGHYLFKHIRGDDRLKTVPIIISTANSILASSVTPDMTENDFLLVKPVEVKKLQAIARTIKARQAT
ncbi:MAG: response regulator [Anaerolineae bacterium]|jgi:DNA-binding response OmpR family regulator|nr:response regulator [Anaerolineae bacterium]